MLGLFLFSFLILEGWLYYIKPSEVDKKELYRESLNEAVKIFEQTQTTLLEESRELSERLQGQLQGQYTRQSLYQSFQQYGSFWGTTMFQNGIPQVWRGFSFSEFPEQIPRNGEDFVDIVKKNNVILMLCHIPFAIEDSSGTIPFNLVTSKRIEQNNALPIGKDKEYNLLHNLDEPLKYPVELSFFESLPSAPIDYEVLSTISKDSVGIAYTPSEVTGISTSDWGDEAWFWRSMFLAISYMILCLFFYFWLESREGWQALFFQLGIIGTLWLFCYYLSIPEQWVSAISGSASESTLKLSRFSRLSVFGFLLAVTLSRHLRSRNDHFSSSNFFRTLTLAGLYGLLNVELILGFISHVYPFLIETEIQLFDLQIFPNASTLIVYLSFGLLLFSLGLALTSLGYYILRSEREQDKLVITIAISTFIIGLLIFQLYLPRSLTMNWAFVLAIAFFGCVLGLAALQLRFRRFFASFSLLRSLALYSFFVALLGLPILENAQYERIDNRLMSNASEFLVEEDPTARNITRNVLTTLENEFSNITTEDLEQQVPFLQSQFTQTIVRIITPEWSTYSLNLQLIRPDGTLIADYSTDLNAPNWTNVFDLSYLSAATDIERITKSTNRPIIQIPDLENAEHYETFYRGWISIFGQENNDQIAWILCSVYREHPEFNKPIRAVLAALSYTDWEESHLLLEYNDGKLVRSNKQGVVGRFPKFNVLRDAETSALEQDSLLYYSNTENEQTYRNLLYAVSDSVTVKASTIYPDEQNLLFSFFRFSFTLLLAGFIVIPLIYAITHKELMFWGASTKFEHRILDSFLLATLLFLGLLIVTTNYAIKNQNEEIVRQELFDKLEELATNTENNDNFKRSLRSDTTFTLESLTSPLNVDAAYYDNKVLRESTTPQIYQQHLLPTTLPFQVYHDLFLVQRRESIDNVSLASQNLLIGYRSLLSPDDQPVAAIAIPTFVQSPKYDQQLLETTSYLIIFYLFTFGVFVLATTLISKQLTRPLRSIQSGLNEISQGKLDTTIPVNSNDEIGSLAMAYNEMVDRLKDLRRELAVAEREAAWKEMAQQVAHEIKNPLTPMKLNIQHLERQLTGNSQSVEELKSQIRKITRNLTSQINTLNSIASDFSKFSQPISEEFTKVNANEILESVVDLYQHDNQINVETDLTEYPIYVNGVPDELKRVFINLVKNAFEAMPEEGGNILLISFMKEGSAFFEVDDDGNGIPEENKSKIFVPNFSTKSSGTGLGLAICKKIIEAHGGTITFASIEGKGTTFIIKMPIYKS